MDLKNKKLIVIVGPTAVGKTEVSIRLATTLNTEIISADSRQFYNELSIGTAKPSEDNLRAIPHHFINSHSIQDDYDAARYGDEALELIQKLFEYHDYLIVCGGSGLYIKALLEGFDEIPEVPDEIRSEIIRRYEKEGLIWLQNRMEQLDAEYFNLIDQQNPARLIRALEVVMGTGKSISTFQKKEVRVLPFQVVKIGLELERDELYKRIDARVDKMIESGLFDECKTLYPYRNHNALQTVGYTEVFDFMDGKYDREEAIRLVKRNSRRYAKRQLTWFKRDVEIRWFKPIEMESMIQYCTEQKF